MPFWVFVGAVQFWWYWFQKLTKISVEVTSPERYQSIALFFSARLQSITSQRKIQFLVCTYNAWLLQKTSKSDMIASWPVTFGTVSALIARLITFQHYHVTQRLVAHNKNKSIRQRLRPRPTPVWDRSCHKTAVWDPKTCCCIFCFVVKTIGQRCDTAHTCCFCHEFVTYSECVDGVCRCHAGYYNNNIGTECLPRNYDHVLLSFPSVLADRTATQYDRLLA